MKYIFRLSFVFVSVLIISNFFVATVYAGNIQAVSCSQSDVQAAITLSKTGDTVTIPSGTCTWTTQLKITKGVTLQGNGVGKTIIKDGKQTGGGMGGALIAWSCEQNSSHRLAGIEFQNGGRTGAISDPAGVIVFNCTNMGSTTVRVDNNKFDHLNGSVLAFNTAVGVADHNTFLSDIPIDGLIRVQDPYWNVCDPAIIPCVPVDTDGWKDGWGDHSWHDPVVWGSKDFLFVEDNYFAFINPDGSDATARSCHDGMRGTRLVWRYNSMYRCAVSNHGTESGQRSRGGVAMEVYKNGTNEKKWDGGSKVTMSDVRSGAILTWDNIGTNFGSDNNAVTLNDNRTGANFNTGFFASSGAVGPTDSGSQWDINDTKNPYTTGKIGSQTGTVAQSALVTITVSPNPNWTANQWVNFILNKTGNCNLTTTQCSSRISANTSNTITFYEPSGLGVHVALLSFLAGDTFEINKLVATLDQPGRIGGSLITCGAPCLTPPSGWNNQIVFPSYEWGNTNNGKDAKIYARGSCGPTCIENTHFYNNTPLSGYTPYVYPHPLVSGTSYTPPTHVEPTPATPPPAEPPVTITIPPANTQLQTNIRYNFGTTTLRNGSRGEAVKELQRFLNAKLNLGLVIDGKLGPKTIAVIKTWQRNHGLVADGLIGPKTKAMMNAK